MPPIQFIMDETATDVSEVEELLKVADMGPDFDPTSPDNSLKSGLSLPYERFQRKVTDSSYRSDVGNLGAIPGPGDSMELVVSKTKDHTQSLAQHPESWNGASEEVPPVSAAETLDNENTTDGEMSPSDDDETVTSHDSIERRHHSRRRHSPVAGSEATQSTPEVRSDIFGLDHARLWQQVLHAKRKSADRSYRLPDELIAEFSAASESDGSKKDFTRDVVARSKMRRRDKDKRLCRNPDYLSFHYHNSTED